MRPNHVPGRQALFEEPAVLAAAAGGPLVAGWWDTARTARMSLWSSTMHPFWIHHWLNFLEGWRPAAPLTAPMSQVPSRSRTHASKRNLCRVGPNCET